MTPDNGDGALFRSLEQQRTFERIMAQIEQAIVEGRLEPGDRLPPERELATTFGVGRSAVREALRVLEMFGAVVARRGTGPEAGSIVASSATNGIRSVMRLHVALLRIPVEDVVEMRVVLESHNATRAAKHATADDLKRLNELIILMRAAESPENHYELDTDFHVAIATASGNAVAPVLMEGLRGAIEREMVRGLSALPDWPAERAQLAAEHERITRAIASRKPKAATDAVRAHIERFYHDVLFSDRTTEPDGGGD